MRVILAAFAGLVMASAVSAEESLTERYRDVSGRILGAALTDVEGWEKLVHLTTRIGNRLSGSAGLEEAIEWAYTRMQQEDLVEDSDWMARLVEPGERVVMLGVMGFVLADMPGRLPRSE